MDPETGKPYADFNIGDISEMTSKNIDSFENCVIVIDDMGNKLKNNIAEYFDGGRHDDIQMIVIGHKPAQIFNTARMSCDTIFITIHNGADLFKNFIEIYNSKHDFHGITKDLNRSFYKHTDKTAEALRYGLIKYNVKEDNLIVFDKNRTTIYDSTVGFMDSP